MRGLKFFNKKFENEYGKWDSKLEFMRFLYLNALQKDGIIKDLQRQVTFELLPKQTEKKVVHLKTKDKIVEVFLEHPATYIADFVYFLPDGTRIIEDTKSVITRKQNDYILKRKLMRWRGTPIVEVTKPGEEINAHGKG